MVECHVDVLPLLFGGGVGLFVHERVALYGYLAGLMQVGIAVDERVEALQILRLVEFLHLIWTLLSEHLQAGHHHRAPCTAVVHVVVAQHVVAGCLVADDA